MPEIARGRFAPSPSGRLHLGNIMSSLLAWLDIRALGGEMVFRLEDLDPDRSWDEYAQLCADDLLWLGLDWDEGWPDNRKYAQGNRTALYEEAFSDLSRRGLVYPCFCSRTQRLAASAPHPGDSETDAGCRCRKLTETEIAAKKSRGGRAASKIRVPDIGIVIDDGHYGRFTETFRSGHDDFIIRRSDGVFAYQLAVSVDDADMGITRVVRARDLLFSSHRQKWLIETIGGTPPEYCHAPLLTAPDGRKLSKREGDLNMETLRARFTPEELIGRLAALAGLVEKPEAVAARELISEFGWEKVPVEDIIIPEDF
ncbi:MAG: tRNA glutamyl-Q(34) synthetase GluQRS [Clostridia bacterium]|nr:tRNA glutamyl-Q(34) synthetase GluQRS [Clostridia bacterium]